MSARESHPEYKSSGVEWLGDIPKNWELGRLGTYFVEIDTRLGDSDPLPLLSVSQNRGVVRRDTLTDKEPRADDLGKYKVCASGDIVLSRFNAYRGALGVSKERGIVSPDYMVLRAVNGSCPEYIGYLLRSNYLANSMKLTMGGIGGSDPDSSGFSRINQYDLIRFKVPRISASEQRSIASFLDHETAEIDEFISDQDELIALLNERRVATITQMVSRGLNMKVQMRKSGREVVPDFPKHWVMEKLSRLGLMMESGTSVNGYSDEGDLLGVRVLKTGCASKGYFDPAENKKVIEEDVHRVSCPVRSGSLIVNRANTPELVGSCALAGGEFPNLYLSDKLWQLNFMRSENRFLYWWMKTPAYRAQIKFHAVGASATMQNLSFADFRSFAIALPPISEQVEIADYLDHETAEIDAAIADAKEAVELSKERRAALISAAVTGKIDVRNHITAELGAA